MGFPQVPALSWVPLAWVRGDWWFHFKPYFLWNKESFSLSPLNFEKYIKLLVIFGDTISKFAILIRKITPLSAASSYSSLSIELKLFVNHYESTCIFQYFLNLVKMKTFSVFIVPSHFLKDEDHLKNGAQRHIWLLYSILGGGRVLLFFFVWFWVWHSSAQPFLICNVRLWCNLHMPLWRCVCLA